MRRFQLRAPVAVARDQEPHIVTVRKLIRHFQEAIDAFDLDDSSDQRDNAGILWDSEALPDGLAHARTVGVVYEAGEIEPKVHHIDLARGCHSEFDEVVLDLLGNRDASGRPSREHSLYQRDYSDHAR